jgi:C1A family cysteine protease
MLNLNQVVASTFDLRDYKIQVSSNIPETFELDNLPKVKNQGNKPTCVAHACSSLMEWHYLKNSSKYRVFSTQFIYGLRDIGYYIGNGMMVRNALKTMVNYGVPFNSKCPGNDDYEEAIKDVSENLDIYLQESCKYKIVNYFKCNKPDEIKSAIMKHGPVIMAMNYNHKSSIDNDCYIDNPEFNGSSHCMLIYGWNEKGWLIQNSWGTTFAEDGRFTLPYSQKISEAWGITYNNNESGDIIKPNSFKLKIYKIYNKIVNFILSKN